MANVEHSVLTGSALHEPKGVATAGAGAVYLATGGGSGTWVSSHSYASLGMDGGSQSLTSSQSFVTITPSGPELSGFTHLTSPNFRVRYDGVPGLTAQIHFNSAITAYSYGQGSTLNATWIMYKNGVAIPGAKTTSRELGSVHLQALVTLATNDYIEIKGSNSGGSTSVSLAALQLSILGMSK
jgi:hypothetical protein